MLPAACGAGRRGRGGGCSVFVNPTGALIAQLIKSAKVCVAVCVVH